MIPESTTCAVLLNCGHATELMLATFSPRKMHESVCPKSVVSLNCIELPEVSLRIARVVRLIVRF